VAFGVEAVTGQTRLGVNAALSFTVTSANLLLVGISIGQGTPGTILAGVALARNGQSFSAVASSAADDGNFCGVKWFRLDNPNAGTFDITSTGLDAAAQAAVHAVSFIDANLTLNAASTATGTSANPSVVVATSASGDIVVAVSSNDNSTGNTEPTSGQGFTEIFDGEDISTDTDQHSLYKTATGSNTTMSWEQSSSGDGWAASGFAVSPAAGGGVANSIAWIRA
jgi:hypothetical protein